MNISTLFSDNPLTHRKLHSNEPMHPAKCVDIRKNGGSVVLLVEDDEAVRAAIRLGLETYHFKVLEAFDAADALRVCREYAGPIHIVITDIIMPVLWGHDLARQLADMRPQSKVLYISGLSEEAVVARGLLTVDDAFLEKPFSSGVLAAKLQELLERQADPQVL